MGTVSGIRGFFAESNSAVQLIPARPLVQTPYPLVSLSSDDPQDIAKILAHIGLYPNRTGVDIFRTARDTAQQLFAQGALKGLRTDWDHTAGGLQIPFGAMGNASSAIRAHIKALLGCMGRFINPELGATRNLQQTYLETVRAYQQELIAGMTIGIGLFLGIDSFSQWTELKDSLPTRIVTHTWDKRMAGLSRYFGLPALMSGYEIGDPAFSEALEAGEIRNIITLQKILPAARHVLERYQAATQAEHAGGANRWNQFTENERIYLLEVFDLKKPHKLKPRYVDAAHGFPIEGATLHFDDQPEVAAHQNKVRDSICLQVAPPYYEEHRSMSQLDKVNLLFETLFGRSTTVFTLSLNKLLCAESFSTPAPGILAWLSSALEFVREGHDINEFSRSKKIASTPLPTETYILPFAVIDSPASDFDQGYTRGVVGTKQLLNHALKATGGLRAARSSYEQWRLAQAAG